MKKKLSIAFVLFFLTSCMPPATELPILIPPTNNQVILTLPPTYTPTAIQALHSLESKTPTAAIKKSVLLAYTLWVDGGGELENCLAGSNQPIFILYSDGDLIFLQDNQYWYTKLSQKKIDLLVNQVINTGLPQVSEMEEDAMGERITLFFNEKKYLPPDESYSTSAFKKVIDLITEYSPDSKEPYIPSTITLWIFTIRQLAPFEEYLPKPIPSVRNWSTDLPPLSQYGNGYENLSGDIVPKVMTQFDGFPDYQIFNDEKNFMYITAICANISFQ